jgi:ABC-type Fe3+-hydroxamate transport system substrate-binding protein
MSVRVVSLVPSSTETLVALGADVVACTRFCEQPDLVHVGGTKNPDLGAIIALRPDVVVLDREENRIEDHDALIAAGLRVFVSDVRTVGDAVAFVGELTALVYAPTEPFEMCLAHLEQQPPTVVQRRTAFVPIWRRPWMSIGAATYGASLLDHLGIDLVTADAVDAYPTVELDEIAARRPDLVLVPSEPYVFDNDHVAELRSHLPDADIIRVDGQDLFWWGIRTPEAITRLSGVL